MSCSFCHLRLNSSLKLLLSASVDLDFTPCQLQFFPCLVRLSSFQSIISWTGTSLYTAFPLFMNRTFLDHLASLTLPAASFNLFNLSALIPFAPPSKSFGAAGFIFISHRPPSHNRKWPTTANITLNLLVLNREN